jgi:hypothetical protein
MQQHQDAVGVVEVGNHEVEAEDTSETMVPQEGSIATKEVSILHLTFLYTMRQLKFLKMI